jgi:hypothetical protein
MTEVEKLEKELQEAKLKLEQAREKEKHSARNLAIKDLSEFTDKEKIEVFDRLYYSAMCSIEELEKNGFQSEDDEHYSWEELISIPARDREKFWKYYNSLT